MNAYTVSHLAHDAGVSVHIVRDYVLRGLVQPAVRTDSGYGIFDARALRRLRFVRAAFEAGIPLDTLARLCRALDAGDAVASERIAELHRALATRRQALREVEAQLREFAPTRSKTDERMETS